MAQGLSVFRKFIPADLVRSLLRQGVEAKPGGAVQELTVMFIDIAGFTGLSERMGDRVVPLLSEYLNVLTEQIVAHDGTIDKFIGDAIMAFWGAPTAQQDHAHVVACENSHGRCNVKQSHWSGLSVHPYEGAARYLNPLACG